MASTIVTSQRNKTLVNVKESVSNILELLNDKGSFIKVTKVEFDGKQSQMILKKSTVLRAVKKKKSS